jgi:hypothetical protein
MGNPVTDLFYLKIFIYHNSVRTLKDRLSTN